MIQKELFKNTEEELLGKGYNFERKDLSRPWGAFWVISSDQKKKFVEEYFSDLSLLVDDLPISPKILMVAPKKRLSWQYHDRRSEAWKILEGVVGVVKSRTDKESRLKRCVPGERIFLCRRERHRLVGLNDWGIIAEIWMHTDENNLSDEDDIVRLQDDFVRR